MLNRLALAGILLLAAVLRFTALGWGLRHVPHLDEQYFVENVRGMLVRGDLDHRFHEYPGLLFYILLPFVSLTDTTTLAREGYLLARGVVAAFGVGSVGLAYLLGRRLAGAGAGLAASLLLAVSPVEVQSAHSLRPDVVLEAFVLLAFLAFSRLGSLPRQDLLSGVAVGLATAVKFSGVLLAPSYAIQRLLTPGPRVLRLALAGAIALATYAVCSPYTLLDFEAFLAGARTQVAYHYQERPRGPQHYAGMAATYGLVLVKGLGWPGILLVAMGVALCRREWRRWLALLAFPLLVVAVFSTAEVHHDRFLLPTLGVLAQFAGRAVQSLQERSRAGALAVALAAAAFPLAASVGYLRGISRPGTRDLALDWVESTQPAGARILTTLPELGLNGARYEVLRTSGFDARARRLAPEVDLVIAAEEAQGLHTLHDLVPSTRLAGPRILMSRVIQRPEQRSVVLQASWLAASEGPDKLPALLDEDPETRWETAGPQTPGTWIEVHFPRPVFLSRVELVLGRRTRHYAGNLHVFVRDDGRWSRVRVFAGRPPVDEQVSAGRPASQLLLLEPVPTRGLRLVQVGRRARPWSAAELRLSELVPAPQP